MAFPQTCCFVVVVFCLFFYKILFDGSFRQQFLANKFKNLHSAWPPQSSFHERTERTAQCTHKSHILSEIRIC